MSRPRTPTAVLDARGAFKKDPQRKREGEPVVKDPIGSPPEELTPEQLKGWQMFVERAPMGVLTSADWPAVYMASILWAGFMADPDFPAGKLSRLEALMGKFGLTPSDRAKLNIPKPKEENPFAQLDTDYRN